MYKTKKPAPPVPPRPSIRTKPTISKPHPDELTNNNRLVQLEEKPSPAGRTVIYKSPSTSNVIAKHDSAISSKLNQKTFLNLQKTNNQQNNDIIPIMKKENTRNYYYKYEDDSPLNNISLISSTQLPSSQLHTSAGCYSKSVLTQNDKFNNNNKYNSILQLPENHVIPNNSRAYELKRNKTEIIIKLANSSGVRSNNLINNKEKYEIQNKLEKEIDQTKSNVISENLEAPNVNRIKIANNNSNYEQKIKISNNNANYEQKIKTPTPLYRSKSTLCTIIPRKRSSIVFIEDTDTMKKSAERLFSEIVVNKNNQNIDPYENSPRINLSKRPEPEGGCETTEKSIEAFETVNQRNKFKFNRELTFHEILISELSENREKKSKELLIRNENNITTSIINDRSGKEIEKINKTKIEENSLKFNNSIVNAFNNKKKILSERHINIDDSGLEDETERSLEDYSGNVNFLDNRIDKKIECKNEILSIPKSLSNIDNSFYVEKLTNSINTLNQKSPITNSKLDSQLEILRKEMLDLRKLDISLLLQLKTLDESIQEFRTMLQEQEQLNEESECSSSDESSASSENNKEFPISVPQKLIPKKQVKPLRAESFQQKRAYKSRPAPQPPSISRSLSKS